MSERPKDIFGMQRIARHEHLNQPR